MGRWVLAASLLVPVFCFAEDRFEELKRQANEHYQAGRDKDAALLFEALIKERPRSPEAVGLQAKLIDSVVRSGNKRATVEQVRRLIAIHDPSASSQSRAEAEEVLSRLAVTWHNECRKTRDDECFALDGEVYAAYLTLFPDTAKAYDLRFFWAELLLDNLHQPARAGEQYTRVLIQNPAGKWAKNAAYNAVIAYDEAARDAKLPGAVDLKEVAIPPAKQQLLDACERYLKLVPAGDKQVEIAFKAAKIFYDHNHFDEAVKRFSKIALENADYRFENGDRAGEISANLVLDIYNLLGDWKKVNEWARRFLANERLMDEGHKKELELILDHSRFKLIMQLEGRKDYSAAAQAYLAFVAEFPGSSLADRALSNAAVNFVRANQLEKATGARKRLIASYPRSYHVPDCLYALAETSEAAGDRESAASYYELYVDAQDRNEAKALTALLAAGKLREALGQRERSLQDREKFLDRWPDAPASAAVFQSVIDLLELGGDYAKAIDRLERYREDSLDEPERVLCADGRISRLYNQRVKSAKDVRRVSQRLLSYVAKLPPGKQKALTGCAAEAVTRARYQSSVP
jgi:TolA-binding protein